jgi:hypothetical protein
LSLTVFIDLGELQYISEIFDISSHTNGRKEALDSILFRHEQNGPPGPNTREEVSTRSPGLAQRRYWSAPAAASPSMPTSAPIVIMGAALCVDEELDDELELVLAAAAVDVDMVESMVEDMVESEESVDECVLV